MSTYKYTDKIAFAALFGICVLLVIGCGPPPSDDSEKEAAAVSQQQAQYAKGQPVPHFDWSLERDLLAQLYELRNRKVATHAVWRSDFGTVEGDCPSMGYGLPYDTSLTNPLQPEWKSRSTSSSYTAAGVSIGQAEPNGIYASTNTAATWVMCVDETGALLPTYVEAKVTVYPYPVTVNYEGNRVVRVGGSKAVTLKAGKP